MSALDLPSEPPMATPSNGRPPMNARAGASAAPRTRRPGRCRTAPDPSRVRAARQRVAQRCVRSIACARVRRRRAAARSARRRPARCPRPAPPGWRSTISGVRRWREPSMCEVNVAPSSSTRTSRACLAARSSRRSAAASSPGNMPICLPTPCSRPEPSENTWKPPLSVTIGPSQPMKRCSPPSWRTTSAPGRKNRWYVLASSTLGAQLAQLGRRDALDASRPCRRRRRTASRRCRAACAARPLGRGCRAPAWVISRRTVRAAASRWPPGGGRSGRFPR